MNKNNMSMYQDHYLIMTFSFLPNTPFIDPVSVLSFSNNLTFDFHITFILFILFLISSPTQLLSSLQTLIIFLLINPYTIF